MPGTETASICFGIFEVDRRSGELRRNGVKVKLQEQPLQILLTLLERPGDVISREELRGRLWADDTYVDFDHSLNAAVRRLRDALGDSAENPRFVETVARRGYRFLVPIQGNGAIAQPAVPTHISQRWWVLGAVGLGVLLVGIAVGWRVGHVTESPKSLTERRLTANAPENLVTEAAISPDGKYLAFADAGGFFLRQIETGETRSIPLPKGFDAKPAGWFPDGVHMLATWVAGPQALSSIWEISVLGGTPRKLADQGMWPAVSPDGLQVAFVTGSLEPTEIRLMQADGTNVRKLVEDDGMSFFGPPVWAPDGKKIAYARGKYAAGNARIEGHLEALDLASGRQSPLLSMPDLRGTIAWTPDGRLIYSLNEPIPNQNDANLWAVRIDQAGYPQGPGKRLTHGPGFAGLMSLTTDGKRLAYFRRAMEPDVYIADLESNGTKLSEPRRLTFDERSDFPYSWTPDNKAVLFVSNRNGAFNVFKQNVNETEPEVLERGSEDLTISRLSPDGSSVLYLVPPLAGDSSHDVRLMRMPLAGGPPQTVLVAAGGNNYQCARLPYTVCVVSTIDSGRERFFYFDLEKSLGSEIAKAQVQSTNSFDYNWSLSPDGKTLALAKKSGMQKESGIRLLPLEGGTGRIIRVTGDWLGIGSVDWAADGKSLWATAYTSTGPRSLLKVDLGGRVRTMLEEKKMNLGWAIPSPDGKHLALWKATGSSNVWMLENF